MNFRTTLASCVALLALTANAVAMTISKGTAVTLAFDQPLSSKNAHAGDQVRLHVVDDLVVGGKTVIKSGTKVSAVVSEVHGKGRFGKNAQMKLTIDPVMVHGVEVPLQPRQKGNMVGGSRGTQAAGAAGAGALVL